jgi:biotin operon repressor
MGAQPRGGGGCSALPWWKGSGRYVLCQDLRRPRRPLRADFRERCVFSGNIPTVPEFALKEGKGKGVREKFGEGAEELEEKLGEKLAENERHILQLIHSNRRISINDMAKEVGISTTAVHKNLTKLKQRGILRRVGPDKGGHWEVVRQKQSHGGDK